MKPKIWTSILLFISAYSPLFLILAVKDFDFDYTCRFQHPFVIYVMLGLSILSVLILFLIIKFMPRGNMPVVIKTVSNRSVDLINYTIPYILSFFGFDLSKYEDIISLAIFLTIMLVLTITSRSLFLNPILAFAGYGLYDIEYQFNERTKSIAVLSKHELKSGQKFYIKSLTRFLYLVKEKVKND
ncbi:hypothetical protein F6U93_04260 [Tamlana haliotis]|uniref:Uncharacterized protein n=1 Tax=Pseudotamlana haliotis TaxID=2614804 RepID=A0A6N6MGG9_9FLAO|nr:hypothetical protein [Tamlana haliotis]KAB1068974.1 hypothetical protein F6U93_04260 [Tamlana haliotis]